MKKMDLKETLKGLYTATSKEVTLIKVPRMKCLMVDGAGDPNTSQEFQDAIGALYGMAFTLKFMFKKEKPPKDYTVMPLEGLWWCEGQSGFDMGRRDLWRWTLLIVQPDFITPAHFAKALEQVRAKKENPALEKIRLKELEEGPSLQTLHVGPYSTEAATFERMHKFMEELGCSPTGKHHEIYLGDPRRAKPEKLKTILRQPVERVGCLPE